MKARERIIRRYLAGSEKFEAVVAIETAALAPSIGYWASRQLAVKLGCPVALWRLAYLCEMGKQADAGK